MNNNFEIIVIIYYLEFGDVILWPLEVRAFVQKSIIPNSPFRTPIASEATTPNAAASVGVA